MRELPLREFLCSASIALLVGGCAAGANAAQIKVLSTEDVTCPVIRIKGDLNEEDGARFAAVILPFKRAIIEFDSKGGALGGGIFIGKLINEYRFWTTVRPKKLCASACALAWLGGSKRFVEKGAKIGFHAAYTKQKGRLSEHGMANAIIGAYLTRLGLSEYAVAYATASGPAGMTWLTPDDADAVGIEVTFGTPPNATPSEPATTSMVRELPQSPAGDAAKAQGSATQTRTKQIYDRLIEGPDERTFPANQDKLCGA